MNRELFLTYILVTTTLTIQLATCELPSTEVPSQTSDRIGNFNNNIMSLWKTTRTANSRTIRSANASIGLGDACNVTENELVEIENAVKTQILDLDANDAYNNTSDCLLFTTYVKNLATFITSETNILYQLKDARPNSTDLLTKTYREKLIQFNVIAELLKYIATDPATPSSSQIRSDIADMQRAVNIHSLVYVNYTAVRHEVHERLIVFMIQEDNSDFALFNFNSLHEQGGTDLQIIIDRSYDNDLTNFESVLRFISQLTNCTDNSIGFTFLFDAMNRSSHLRSPKILILQKAARLQCRRYKIQFLSTLKNYTDDVINTWIDQIHVGNFEPSISFFRDFLDIPLRSLLESYFYEIIDGVYRKSRPSLDHLFTFVESLYYGVDSYQAYYSLFEVMSHNEDIGNNDLTKRFIHSIKQTMNAITSNRLNEKFVDLLKLIPQSN